MNELTPKTEKEIIAVYELLCQLRGQTPDPAIIADLKVAMTFKNKKLMVLVTNLASLPN